MRMIMLAAAMLAAAACASTPEPTNAWSPARTEERTAPYLRMPTPALRVAANNAVASSEPVAGGAYLYYALGLRLMADETRIADRREGEEWLARAALTPVVRVTSVRQTSSGARDDVFSPQRQDLSGLPEAQYRLWSLWRDSIDRGAAARRLLRLAAAAGYEPAVREVYP